MENGMTVDQLKERLKNDPLFLANVVIQNNPMGVAKKAVELNLTTILLADDQLIALAQSLLQNQQTEAFYNLLNVPVINSGNSTDGYAMFLKQGLPQMKLAGSSGNNNDVWGNILKGVGVIAAGLGEGLVNKPDANAPTSPTPPTPKTPEEKTKTWLYVTIGIGAAIVLTVITLAIVKATKK